MKTQVSNDDRGCVHGGAIHPHRLNQGCLGAMSPLRLHFNLSGSLQSGTASIVLANEFSFHLRERESGIKRKVRRRFIHYVTTLILTVCLWGYVSEIFDHWDNTFQTGNDIEYSTVIVVLIAGAVISFARVAAIVLRGVSATSYLLSLFAACVLAAPSTAVFIAHSPPPLALRI
jgi:hypothetical protein